MLTEEMHLMVDLETLSLHPHALVLSAGACVFNSNGIHQSWHWRLDGEKQHRRRIDLSTVQWWMKQSAEARAASFDLEENVELIHHYALRDELSRIRNQYDVKKWWAHSPSFDGVILNTLFGEELCGHKHWLDTRTFMWLTGTEMPRLEGVHHNAKDDAVNQAQYIVNVCRNRYS